MVIRKDIRQAARSSFSKLDVIAAEPPEPHAS